MLSLRKLRQFGEMSVEHWGKKRANFWVVYILDTSMA
jgi:hypothetical protein